MSDEQKIEEELDSDDVEAHKKGGWAGATEEAPDDSDEPDVEAHKKGGTGL